MYTFVAVHVVAATPTSEKLIVSYSTDPVLMDEDLLKLKIYFIENPEIRILEEKYQLIPTMETLENQHMVVVRNIHSLKLRNALLLLLIPLFPDIFYIDAPKTLKETKQYVQADDTNTKKRIQLSETPKESITWINEIGLQWIVIWFLALLGLLLSLWNRRKMSKLDEKQKDIRLDQNKIEKEIKKLGASNA